MAAYKLVDVPLQMFDGHLVIGPVVSPLEQRPERLDPLRVNHPIHVLLRAVLDDFPEARDEVVTVPVVRIGDCRRVGGLNDKRRRGRPRIHKMPPRIDASPEEIAQALLKLPADYEWEFEKKAKAKAATK